MVIHIPLTPLSTSTLNSAAASRSTSYNNDDYEVQQITQSSISSLKDPHQSPSSTSETSGASSPFLTSVINAEPTLRDQENTSPSKARHSRILSGSELSPLKLLQPRTPSLETTMAAMSSVKENSGESDLRAGTSPRKVAISPEKRFPVRINLSKTDLANALPAQRSPSREQRISLETAMELNRGQDLQQAIDIFEDDAEPLSATRDKTETIQDADEAGNQEDAEKRSLSPEAENVALSGALRPHGQSHRPETTSSTPRALSAIEDDEDDHSEHSMISNFSAFSVVPGVSLLARLGRTPTLSRMLDRVEGNTMRFDQPQTPAKAARSPVRPGSGESTNLLDLTDNLRFPGATPAPRAHRSPLRTTRTTNSRQSIANLLDFDIPPMPTPRSVPSISARELESLKSNFLSEISSLKASLSGKEAEVLSLKTAVGDAEKRVGECLEQLRDERAAHEQLVSEKDNWEQRGNEVESVLRQVKEDIEITQRDREELEAKLEESEKRRDAAEMMAQEAESRIAAMRAGKDKSPPPSTPSEEDGAEEMKSPKPAAYYRDLEKAMTQMAKNLHDAYRNKHEVKVAALKKTYEARWSKKVQELEGKVVALAKANDELKHTQKASASVSPGKSAQDTELTGKAAKLSTEVRELHAEVENLDAMVKSVQSDNAQLRTELEQERVEKGDLVTLAEELMQIQSMQSMIMTDKLNGQDSHELGAAVQATPAVARTPAPIRSQPLVDNLRASIRGSGLKAPSSRTSGLATPAGERIGREVGRLDSKRSNGVSAARTILRPGGTGLMPPRSGIMNSIEQMGSYRGRTE